MSRNISAYLSIYEDWDLLRPSLESVRPYVDEIVVVDGAYKWMAGYLTALGSDPAKSSRRVYEGLQNLGIPIRVITDTWENEYEKRAAGFAACSGRYVMRIDADEMIFIDEPALDRFIESGQAAAQMKIPPIYFSPDFVTAVNLTEPMARVGFLFDKHQLRPVDHLRYLWIFGAADNTRDDTPLPPPFPEAIALAAHMTNWRSPEGARGRAAFYNLNYIKDHGCPWLPDLAGRPIGDLSDFFVQADPALYHEMLLQTEQAFCDISLGDRIIVPSPLNDAQRNAVRPYFERFIHSHTEFNRRSVETPLCHLQGAFSRLDATTWESLGSICVGNIVSVIMSHTPIGAKAFMHILAPDAPFEELLELPIRVQDRLIQIEIPSHVMARRCLRRVIRFQTWSREFDRLQHHTVTRRHGLHPGV